MGAKRPPPLPRGRRWVLVAAATSSVFFVFTSETFARADLRETLRICGAHACARLTTTDSRLYPLLFNRHSSPLPPPASAFYVLELSIEGAPHVQKGWYVPSSHTTRWLMPAPSEWTKLTLRGAAFLRHHLPAGRPHRAPHPVRVVLAHERVQHTAPYAHVFDRFPKAPGPPPGAHWISIRVLWPVGTPWRFEHTGMDALPSHRILARAGGWFRIPAAFAEVIARDAHR